MLISGTGPRLISRNCNDAASWTTIIHRTICDLRRNKSALRLGDFVDALRRLAIRRQFFPLILRRSFHAELLVQVDKSTQRMTVTVDGEKLYDWPVSTGGRGYETPNGAFKPFRMEIDHYSDEYDQAPMPHSIFFTQTGIAIHGTNEQRSLGRAVSHGCVRLSLQNAATLWTLVKSEKMANTKVVLRGPAFSRTASSARSASSRRLATDKPLEHESAEQAVKPTEEGPLLPTVSRFSIVDR